MLGTDHVHVTRRHAHLYSSSLFSRPVPPPPHIETRSAPADRTLQGWEVGAAPHVVGVTVTKPHAVSQLEHAVVVGQTVRVLGSTVTLAQPQGRVTAAVAGLARVSIIGHWEGEGEGRGGKGGQGSE